MGEYNGGGGGPIPFQGFEIPEANQNREIGSCGNGYWYTRLMTQSVHLI